MKTLIITGKMAAGAVEKAVSSISDTDVLVVPTDVASLITPSAFIKAFEASPYARKTYDRAFVSGFSEMNYRRAAAVLGCPVFRGPKQAADLPLVLELPAADLSETVPADAAIGAAKEAAAKKALDDHEKAAAPETGVSIGGRNGRKTVIIGGPRRMRILAEIAGASGADKKELERQIERFAVSGADMIDIGISPDVSPEIVYETVAHACAVSPVPVSADTLLPEQILAALHAGADMILSLTPENMEEVARSAPGSLFRDKAFVVLPSKSACAPRQNSVSASDGISERIESLEAALRRARRLFPSSVLIADPVLEPAMLGLSASLADYRLFCARNPEIPVFFGAGNVTELFDADSPGINALLAALAAEIGASVLFTTEAGIKTKGAVSELRRAAEMASLAAIRMSAPKDLGKDLLILKEKREKFSGFCPDIFKNASFADAAPPVNRTRDPCGSFRIYLCNASDLGISASCLLPDGSASETVIAAVHMKDTERQTQKTVFVGRTAAAVMETILAAGCVSDIGHAAYLGRELEKAEICLTLGRSYAQDAPFR